MIICCDLGSGVNSTKWDTRQQQNNTTNINLQSRCFARGSARRRNQNQDPDMRNCQSIEDLIQMAYTHVRSMSPRGISAFWTLVPQHLRTSRGKGKNKENHGLMKRQYRSILDHTLERIETFHHRDLTTTALGLAKIVNKVGNSRNRGGSHQILYNLLIGKNSATKEFIFLQFMSASMFVLHEFDARSLSNFIYACGLAGYAPKLKGGTFLGILAEEIPPLLGSFTSQGLSNVIWAYATLNESNPQLLKEVADHIIALDNVDEFKPQHISNIVWAYATAKESHPVLFNKLANAAIKRKNEFSSQEIANFLWAYATNGEIDQNLFSSLVSTIEPILDECKPQDLANIAWSYAVANVDVPSLFDDAFIHACLQKENEFNVGNLTQLHQWHLWQKELESDIGMPPSSLRDKCYDAFASTPPSISVLQKNVVSELSSIGLRPEEEVLTKGGYRLDALVEVSGKKIGVEVDGPSHFLGKVPTCSTILKHRQVANLDGIPVVSVPYWEWNKLGKNRVKKQQYLRSLLGVVDVD